MNRRSGMVAYALLGIASVLLGGFALMNIRSDIQVIIALVALSNAFIFFGLGEVNSRLNRIEKASRNAENLLGSDS
jgi:sulfite exporter TauE/SafE